ncbi:hypothetical protein BHM03_00057284 [Ensete ventricosum]|nr:hypothetical protein BHM03_00057284 [Ensete ventricosum]
MLEWVEAAENQDDPLLDEAGDPQYPSRFITEAIEEEDVNPQQVENPPQSEYGGRSQTTSDTQLSQPSAQRTKAKEKGKAMPSALERIESEFGAKNQTHPENLSTGSSPADLGGLPAVSRSETRDGTFTCLQRGGGAASQGQPSCRAGHPRPGRGQGPLQGGGWLRPGLARKGGQRHPQGAAAACRGDACEQKCRPRGQQPPVGMVDCGQPVGAAAAHGHSRLQHDARKGLLPAAIPAASRRGGHPLARRRPAGKGSRHLRRGSSGAEGERGVRASFGEKDDPTPMNSKNFEDCPHVHNSHNTLSNSKNSKDYPLIQNYKKYP